jgi:hypothetical protein
MARLPQGIMSVAPGLVNEIVGADKRKGLGELIGDNTQAYTDDEFYGGNANNLFSLGAKGTYTDELLRNVFRPGKVVSDVVANVPGVFRGLGEYMSQKGDNERQQDAQKIASNMAGEVFGLPTNQTNLGKPDLQGNPIVPKGLYDAFDTLDGGQGQERLVDAQFPDGLTIQDKINETIENNKSTADGIVNTSFDSDFDADLAGSTGATDGSVKSVVEGANNPAKQATVGALSEFLAQARPGIKPQTYGEYIKEFGDVTGLDVSGDPDNKVALMSFGLALMQNRAGKDFNVSKILTSVGEAGEAAMPDFRRALVKAETIRAKAGEYALGKTEKDKAKAMNRNSYVIIPKQGGLASSILKNNGEFTRLNSYELNNLIDNKKFNDEYEIIDSSVYTDMTKSLITAQNKDQKKVFLETPSPIPLFSGSKTTFDVFYANPNNPTGMKSKVINPELAVNAVETMEKGLTRRIDKFRDIAKVINQTGVSAADQVRSFGNQLAISFGIPIGKGETDPIKQLNTLLTELKARNAAEILGESGKTISDNDRKLVDRIVGAIDVFSGDADINLLKSKLNRLFKQITTSKRDEIDEAYSNLSKFGITVDRKNAATAGTAMVRGEDGVFRFKTQGTT